MNLINYFALLLIALGCSSGNMVPESFSFEAKTVTYRNQQFDIIKLDLTKVDLRLFYQNGKGKSYQRLEKVKTSVERKGKELLFAMNGGMYLKDGSPQGLYIEAGKQLKPVDTIQEAYGNFYLQPNGIFCWKGEVAQVLTTKAYLSQDIQPDYATQSGPMLVIDENIHSVFREGSDNLNIRNGVGVDAEGMLFFAISHKKVNLYDFAMLFKEQLGCPNALYLDGAVSRACIPSLERQQMGGRFGVIIAAMKE